MEYCNITFKNNILHKVYAVAAELKNTAGVSQVRVVPENGVDVLRFPAEEPEDWLLQVLVAGSEENNVRDILRTRLEGESEDGMVEE